MSFLKLVNVSKQYGALQVVSDMNLDIEQGEFISLLGPSGCGKTTTLQMVAGLEPVSGGRIELAGRDITNTKANERGLGIVFQSYALFPHMTVQANVSFGLEMRKVPPHERAERAQQALDLVKLGSMATRYPRELSGGQRQRVALARALVIEPPILLLDEPLSNLDAKLREEMQFELRKIQRKVGTTTIMVTHDQSEALSISDRVVVMDGGRATQIDAPHQLYEYPKTEFISHFIGKMNRLPALVNAQGTHIEMEHFKLAVNAESRSTLRSNESVEVTLRPEKIQIVPSNSGYLQGTVRERYFLGSQWLYTVTTSKGDVTVLAPNDGSPLYEEGQSVGLTWSEPNVRVIRPTHWEEL